jgi:hypothetical protein
MLLVPMRSLRNITFVAFTMTACAVLCTFTECGGSTAAVDAGGPCRAESFPDVNRCTPHWVPLTGDFTTCGFVSAGGYYLGTTDACARLCDNVYVSVCAYSDGGVFCQSGNCESLDTGVME